jgi:hypothetical protein
MANAQDKAANDILKCQNEADEGRRLACYDEVASRQRSSVASTATATATTEPADSAVETAPVVIEAVPAIAATTAPRPDRAQAAAPAIAPVVASSAPVEATPATPAPTLTPDIETEPAASVPAVDTSEFSAIVNKVAEMAHGEHVVYLENGEVWVEEVANSYFPVDAGDTVIIKKRMFGGYRLVTESGKGYRVKKLRN